MTWEEVVALGQRLPEVEVATSYGTPALKVKGRLLTRLRREDDSLVVPGVGADERDMLIEADPRVFHTTPHYDGYPSVLARLGALAPAQLEPLLLRRWRAIAPKRRVAGFDAGGPGAARAGNRIVLAEDPGLNAPHETPAALTPPQRATTVIGSSVRDTKTDVIALSSPAISAVAGRTHPSPAGQ